MEYVSRIGYKVGEKGYHEHCSNYVHAFCALNKTLKGQSETWSYQFGIEKDKILHGKKVPITDPADYNTEAKIALESQIYFVCAAHEGESKTCYDCVEDVPSGLTEEIFQKSQYCGMIECENCKIWFHNFCLKRENMRKNGMYDAKLLLREASLI